MKRLTLVLVALVAACPARTTRHAGISTQAAIVFDVSPALEMMEQFIPEKSVVIHPAVESPPQRQGQMEGPGKGLSATPPSPPEARGVAGRGNARGRAGGPPPIPPPPPAPEISAAGAAVEQTTQGKRAALEPLASFDALGDGFAGRAFPPGGDSNEGRGGAGRGGIDISLAIGPDHIFEILNGNLAVFTKKGKNYDSTGKLLYGAVPNNTVFAGIGVRCGVSNNADAVVRYDQLADRWPTAG